MKLLYKTYNDGEWSLELPFNIISLIEYRVLVNSINYRLFPIDQYTMYAFFLRNRIINEQKFDILI